MSDIKLIVTDLDFTLLHSDRSVSDYTAEVFQKCRGKGILTAFASARFIHGVEEFINKVHPDYLILNDGTMIYHKTDFLFGLPLQPEAANGIVSCLKTLDPKIHISAAAREIVYRNHNSGRFANFTPYSAFDAFEKPFEETIFKLVASPSQEQFSQQFQELAHLYGCSTFQYRGENRHAFLSREAGKFSGICKLSEYLGIPIAQVAAFGDDRNDLEMIQNCGLGIAMANALPELQEAADCVTLSNDQDGVAHYIENHFLR